MQKGELKGSITYAKEDWSLEGGMKGSITYAKEDWSLEGGMKGSITYAKEYWSLEGGTEGEYYQCQGRLKSWRGNWRGVLAMPRRTEVLKGELKGSITYNSKEDWSPEWGTEGYY